MFKFFWLKNNQQIIKIIKIKKPYNINVIGQKVRIKVEEKIKRTYNL